MSATITEVVAPGFEAATALDVNVLDENGNVLPDGDATDTADAIEGSVAKVKDRIVEGYNLSSVLVHHFGTGRLMVKELARRKKSFTGRVQFESKDFDAYTRAVDMEVSAHSTLKAPKSDNYVRYYLLVKAAAQALGGDKKRAAKIPYGIAVNAVFPACMSLDKPSLTAGVKKGWEKAFTEIVQALTDDNSMSARHIIAFIDEVRASMKTSTKVDSADAKELKDKATRAKVRKTALDDLSKAVDQAMAVNEATGTVPLETHEVTEIVHKIAQAHKVELPVDYHAAAVKMKLDDVQQFAALMASNNVDVARELHRKLGQILAAMGASA